MARTILAGVVVVVVTFLMSFLTDAHAQVPGAPSICNSYPAIKQQLEDKYGEQIIAGGVASDGTVVLLFASADGATFTLLQLSPNGLSCLLKSGEAWQVRGLGVGEQS